MAPALIARALAISTGIAGNPEIRMSVLSVLLSQDKLGNAERAVWRNTGVSFLPPNLSVSERNRQIDLYEELWNLWAESNQKISHVLDSKRELLYHLHLPFVTVAKMNFCLVAIVKWSLAFTLPFSRWHEQQQHVLSQTVQSSGLRAHYGHRINILPVRSYDAIASMSLVSHFFLV